MPERFRFIDLAVRPLGRSEAPRELARGELMDRLTHAEPGPGDDSLEVATASLERKVRLSSRRATGLIILALVLLCVPLVFLPLAGLQEMTRLDFFYGVMSRRYLSVEESERHLAAGLSEEQQLFLFRNSQSMGYEVRSKAFAQLDETLPEDPAEFEEYLMATGWARRAPPGTVREHGGRIDPGNGFWALSDASTAAARYGMVRPKAPRPRVAGSVRPMPPPKEPYDVRQVHRDIWAMLEEAARQPRLISYIPARTAQRLALLGPPEDLAELADQRAFIQQQKRFSFGQPVSPDFWVAKAEELVAVKDHEGLKRWIAVWEELEMRTLSYPAFIVRRAQVLKQAIAGAGWKKEEDRLQRWAVAANPISPKGPLTSVPDISLRAASSIGGSSLPLGLEVTELEPDRKAEHAMADRMSALGAAAVFALLAICAVFEGWRRSAAVSGLAAGLFPLLGRVDFGWVAGLGILLPAAWHVTISWLTPLGGRDLGVNAWEMLPMIGRVGGSVIFATCMLVQTARWRIAKRGGVIGLRPVLWPGWAVAGMAALFVPAAGAVRYLPKWQEEYLVFGSAAAGLPLLWLLWRAFALLFCPRSAALGGVLLCRMLAPCFIAASVGVLVPVPFLKNEERKWVARDTLGIPDPAGSGGSALDARMMNRMREQFRAAIK